MDIFNEAMDDALVKELCSGRQLEEERMHLREHVAAARASAMKGHRTIGGLGKLAVEVSAREFFTIREKYGPDCWGDRGFVRDFQRLEPEMACHKV